MSIEGGEVYLLGQIFGTETRDIPLPDEFVEERKQVVALALDSLGIIPSREVSVGDILRKRFGILDGRVHTLVAVSRELDLQRVRVRNIETKAFRILRHPSRSANLSLYAPLSDMSLGKTLWSLDFGCQINKLLAPLDLTKLKPPDIYSQDYLQAEFPGQMVDWNRYSHLPLSLVLRTHIDQAPKILYEVKEVLASLRSSGSFF